MTGDSIRIAAGAILSIAIALVAHRSRTLSRSGAFAAIVIATACTAAGWSWAWLLISFFVSATLLSRAGESAKRNLASDIVEKGGNRDMWQVLANGGVFAALAVVSLVSHSTFAQTAAAGALAASTADTWSTEIGTLSRSVPRSIVTMKRVPHGTSGGVTVEGLIASVAGGGFIALTAMMLGWPLVTACTAIVGGVGGSIIDSILGATVQEKRWCEQCGRGTERAVHTCGTRTVTAGGIRRVDNDVVNFLSSIGGVLLGSLCLL